MVDVKIWEGVQSLLDDYVGIKPDDQVVVLYSSDSLESAGWVSAALELRSINFKRVWMAPLKDHGISERLGAALPTEVKEYGRLVILGFERDTMSHMNEVAQAIAKFDKTRCIVFRAISSCASLFSHALHSSPQELTARNMAILDRCMDAKELRIETSGGTDLHVTIDSKHRWISNRGVVYPGGVAILPAGEVATFPASIEGIYVADFAFNVNAITHRDSRLNENPVKVWIENGRVVKYECKDDTIRNFLEDCFHTHCAFNVGELGFGTNAQIREPISMNSHINERSPGIHLGFGQHNQDPGIVGYQCAIHLDLIAKGGMVWVDKDLSPIDMENLVPSYKPHPRNTRAEDVFSPGTEELEVDDCCGFLTNNGLKLFVDPECSV